MNNHKINILVLPRWYPNKTDFQLGIFIQRQVALMKDEFDMQVVYAQAIQNQPQKYDLVLRETNGFPEHIIYFKSGSGIFKKLINLNRYKKAQRIGLKQIKKEIMLCHVHVPYRPALLAINLYKKGIPFVVTEHWSGHLNGNYQQKNVLDRLIYKRVLKKAKKISTVSQALKIAFKKNTGFTSTVIPNIIEKTDPKTDSKVKGIQLLSVGDFHNKTKNFSGLLHAFKVVNTKHPTAQLTLIGGGPDFETIVNLAKTLNLPAGSVVFTNRQPHEYVLNAMHNCTIYICNSRFETFGMTVAEALYCGKPVVCTKCGGPEEFLNKNNSILVAPSPPNNDSQHEELAKGILKMIANYENFNSSEISKTIHNQFSEIPVKEKWRKFYQD